MIRASESPSFGALAAATVRRPVYLILTLWGKKYCDYFCSLTAPSLLAPRNVPLLKDRPGSKILIATTQDDWSDLQARPIVRQLAQYVLLHHIDIGAQECANAQLRAASGHRIGCRMAHEDQAIAGWITPDLLMSDGLIEQSLVLLDGGKKIVRFPALRYSMEPILERLRAQGLMSQDAPMTLAPSVLSDIAIDSLHPELLRYDFDCAEFHDYPLWTFWRVPGRRGLILYTVSWGFIADFTAARYDESSFDHSTIDGVFPHDTFGHLPSSDIGVISDSNDGLFMGLTPHGDLVFDNEPARIANRFYGQFGLGKAKRMTDIHRLHYQPEIDDGRRFLHMIPFVFRSGPFDSSYRRLRKASRKIMHTAATRHYRSYKLGAFEVARVIVPRTLRFVLQIMLRVLPQALDTAYRRSIRPLWICMLVAAHILADLLAGRKTFSYCVQRVLERCGLRIAAHNLHGGTGGNKRGSLGFGLPKGSERSDAAD